MTGPDGDEFQNLVGYDAVQRPERLAYTHGSPDEPEQFRATITLEALGEGRTELTLVMRFPAAGALDDALEYGADDGAAQSLDRLAEHLTRGRTTAP